MPSSLASCNKRMQILPIPQQTLQLQTQVIQTIQQLCKSCGLPYKARVLPDLEDQQIVLQYILMRNMILWVLARIEATLEQQNVILNESGQIVKELKNGGEKTSRSKEFSSVNTSLPISTMEKFYELNKTIELDPQCQKLLTSS